MGDMREVGEKEEQTKGKQRGRSFPHGRRRRSEKIIIENQGIGIPRTCIAEIRVLTTQMKVVVQAAQLSRKRQAPQSIEGSREPPTALRIWNVRTD